MNKYYKNRLTKNELEEKYKLLSKQIHQAFDAMESIGNNNTRAIITKKTQKSFTKAWHYLSIFQSDCEDEYFGDFPDGSIYTFYPTKED